MARVRGVITPSIRVGSMLKVSGSMSTNTGVRSAVADGVRGRDVGVADGHDLVAGAHADSQQRQMQRRRAARDRAGVLGADEVRELALERGDLGALRDPAAQDDAAGGRGLPLVHQGFDDRDHAADGRVRPPPLHEALPAPRRGRPGRGSPACARPWWCPPAAAARGSPCAPARTPAAASSPWSRGAPAASSFRLVSTPLRC